MLPEAFSRTVAWVTKGLSESNMTAAKKGFFLIRDAGEALCSVACRLYIALHLCIAEMKRLPLAMR